MEHLIEITMWDVAIPYEPLWEQYKRIIKENDAILLTATPPFPALVGASNASMLKI